MEQFHPLSNGFMLVTMLASILFGWLTLFGTLPLNWGFTLTFMSILGVIASIVSVTPE